MKYYRLVTLSVKFFGYLVLSFLWCHWSLALQGKKMVAQFVVVHKESNKDNLQLISKFAKSVHEKTKGELEIKVVPFNSLLPDSLKKEPMNGFRWSISQVYGGQVEMSQIPVFNLSQLSNSMDVLNMPKIFKDHQHAKKVLDGSIGSELLQNLLNSSNQNIRGLAFTYSGGWRDIYTLKNVKSVKDLKGQKMLYRNANLADDFMHFMGIKIVGGFLTYKEAVDSFFNGQRNAEEVEINRLAEIVVEIPALVKGIKAVLETQHSLFLTALVINEDFFKTLSKNSQKILQTEAQLLAHKERILSIKQEGENRELLRKMGIKFIQLSNEDQNMVSEAARKVQERYRSSLGKYIDEIHALENTK